MAEFKIGDRVRYTGLNKGYNQPSMVGKLGTVTGYEGRLVVVDWDGCGSQGAKFRENIALLDESKPEPKALETALSLVYGDRGADYGHPKHDYDRTAQIWDALLKEKLKDGAEVTARDAILMMVGVKMSRLVNTPGHKDSIIDIAGYAECYDRVRKWEEGDTNS